MTIDSSGNIGIGTTAPAALCHISKTSGTTLYRASVAGNSTVGLEIVKTGATTQSWRIADGQTDNGKLEFYDVTDSATRMCIDGSGNVGIGTISPNHRLTLHKSGTSTFDALNITSGLTNSVGLQLGIDSASNAFFWHTANGGIKFATNNAERVRITNNGITFNGDTAAANALYDYEQGSYTPLSSGASVSITVNEALYTKIGNRVWVDVDLVFASNSSNNNARITLPFAMSANDHYGSGIAGWSDNTDGVKIHVGGATAYLMKIDNTSAGNNHLNFADMSGKRIIAGFYYETGS
jgi:hypothetical protein